MGPPRGWEAKADLFWRRSWVTWQSCPPWWRGEGRERSRRKRRGKGGRGEEGDSLRPLRFGLLLRVCAAAGLPLRAGGGERLAFLGSVLWKAARPFALLRLFEDGVGGVVILRFVKIDL